MARVPPEGINVTEAGIGPGAGDHQYPPTSATTQTPREVPNFADGSGPIFSMYLEMAGEEDKKMAEDWKADADGILIFTGLFSAAVASLISVSIQDIRPNPQDTSNFYLANIYHQTISDPNRSNISLPSSPPPFSPPTYAVWVNSLWFLSLVISLTCALLATLLQQWARRYLRVTQPRYSLHRRARIRTFFAEGFQRYLLPRAVEALPTLLHVALFLFFAGLAVFLCNVNLTTFKLVLSWVGVCTALYGFTTFMPIFCHDSPYYTPLTSLVWPIVIGIPYVICGVLRWFTWSVYFRYGAWNYFKGLEKRYRELLVQGIQKTAEETAFNSPSAIDTRAFMWTFDSLDEDHELERFFSGVPGFRSSKVVVDPLRILNEKWSIFEALYGLLDRTFSSDLLPEPVKKRRAMICAKAVDPTYTPRAFVILDIILSNYQYSCPLVAEILQIVRGWGNNGGEATLWVAATVSRTLLRAQQRDDTWFNLASNGLGVPESVLRDYAAQGDSLSLAVVIHVVRWQFDHFWKPVWPWGEFSKVLETFSKFSVQDTSPELQHDFCALWNQIVLAVRNDNDWVMAFRTLGPIRNIYTALHQNTNSILTRLSPINESKGQKKLVRFFPYTIKPERIPYDPASYPLCNVPGHHPDSTPHILDVSASTTFSRAVLHGIPALAPASLASPVAPSSFVPAPLHDDESPADMPPFDGDIFVAGSFHPTYQTPIENLRVPPISLDPVTACVIQGDIDTSTRIPLSTSEPSTYTPPPTAMASTSPHGVLTVRQIADCHTSSDVLDSPMTVSDHASSSPESHSSLLIPATPGPSRPRLSSTPDLGAAAAGKGSAEAALHEETDTFDPPSAIRENSTAVPHLPPPPSLSSVTDVTIADPSLREPDAEGTGNISPHPSRFWYEIV